MPSRIPVPKTLELHQQFNLLHGLDLTFLQKLVLEKSERLNYK
jgi:hypothetical protein